MTKIKISSIVGRWNKGIYSFAVFLVGLFLPLIFVRAADDCLTSGKICNPLSVNSLQQLLKTILEGAIKIGIPIIALAIVYSGFLFVKARGNSEELSKAKDALIYTLIGAAILVGSWAIAQLISNTVLSL